MYGLSIFISIYFVQQQLLYPRILPDIKSRQDSIVFIFVKFCFTIPHSQLLCTVSPYSLHSLLIP